MVTVMWGGRWKGWKGTFHVMYHWQFIYMQLDPQVVAHSFTKKKNKKTKNKKTKQKWECQGEND